MSKKLGVVLVIGVLLTVVALPNGRGTLFQGARWNSSAQEVISAVGGSDSGNYLRGGLDVKDDGKISKEQNWLVNLWPPGMFYMYGTILYIGGENTLIIAVMLALSIIFWSVLLSWLYRFIEQRTSRLYALVSTSTILIFGWPSHGLFSDQLLGSDGISFALFLTALLLFFEVDLRKPAQCAWSGIGIGFLTALAAYLRVSYEFIAIAVSLGTAILLAVSLGLLLLNQLTKFKRTVPRGLLTVLLFACGVFHLCTTPWRFVAAENIRPGNYSWSVAGSLYWDYRWTPDSVFENRGVGWLSDGGANSACRLDKIKCREINLHELRTGAPFQGGGYSQDEFKSLAFETYSSKPLQLLVDRMGFLLRSWFGFNLPRTPENLIGQMLSFGAFLIVLSEALLALVTGRITRLSGTFLVTVTCFLAPFLIMHIEYRYLEPVKFLSIFFFPIAIINLLSFRDKIRKAQTAEVNPFPEAQQLL